MQHGEKCIPAGSLPYFWRKAVPNDLRRSQEQASNMEIKILSSSLRGTYFTRVMGFSIKEGPDRGPEETVTLSMLR